MTCHCSPSTPIPFIIGEQKALTFQAKNPKVTTFTIQQADYVISKKGEVVKEGVCTVTGHTITAMVMMDIIGFYDITITYRIGQEILKAMFVIQVSA